MRIKNLSMVLFVAFCLARGAFAQAGSSPSPVIHAAVFNTDGTPDQANLTSRVTAMATALPQLADAQNLDVVCLNELRDAASRSTVLAGFQNDTTTTWNIYQPAALAQPGCQDACTTSLYEYEGLTLPLNEWVDYCSTVMLPAGYNCASLTSEAGFQSCVASVCPFLASALVAANNASCQYCMADAVQSESIPQRLSRCATSYDPSSAAKCNYGYGGQGGATLISRYPFVANEYHQFTELATSTIPGLANWGISYGKIQTPLGPVHLFCASHVTTESGMDPSTAQQYNGYQSQDVLSYIQSKANGEAAIYLADTGSGPAVVSSSTGAANAQWPGNFTVLEGLLANLGSNLVAAPDPACTYDCGSPTPAGAAYVDHIMTSGVATTAQVSGVSLIELNGATFFTTPIPGSGGIPYSNHFGVLTDIEPSNNVTSQVSITSSGLSYNRGTKIGTETFTVQNTSSSAMAGPIYLALAISNSAVSAANAAGTSAALPYWVSSGSLAARAKATFSVSFSYPVGTSFTTTPTVYAGSL